MLLYSIPDLEVTFTCNIGLNHIDTEGSVVFVWIDGSNSTYRNFGSIGQAYPVTNPGIECVRHRYRYDDVLSQGWLDVACNKLRNCYFCSKPGKN